MKNINMEQELSLYNLEGKWNDYMFAYLGGEIMIDGNIVCVRISIKKKIAANWFWIHNIDENKKSPKLLDPSKRQN